MSKKPAIITYEDLLEKRFGENPNLPPDKEEEFKNAYQAFVKTLKKINYIDNSDPNNNVHTTIQDKLADVDSSSIAYTSEKTKIFEIVSGMRVSRNDGREMSAFTTLFYPPPDPPEIPIYKNTGTKKEPNFEDTGETIHGPYGLKGYEDYPDQRKASADYWRWTPTSGYSIKPCNGVKDELREHDIYTWVPSEKKCVLDEVTKGRFWGENRNDSKESLFQTQKNFRKKKTAQFEENAKKIIQALRKKIEKSQNTPLCDTCGSFLENGQTTISEIRTFLQNKDQKPCVCKNHIQEYLTDILQEKKGGTKKKTKKQKGGTESDDLLERFIGITNVINCVEKFNYYETAFKELDRILKAIQTQTSNVLTLTMRFPSIHSMYGIFPQNKVTAYGYLLHSFRQNYNCFLTKYRDETNSNRKKDILSEMNLFYDAYVNLFLLFFWYYLTDKDHKHSPDFEYNTQIMCSEFPKLINSIQEYLKKVIPDPSIIAILENICTPVIETKTVLISKIPSIDPKIIKKHNKKTPRLYARPSYANTVRLPAYSEDRVIPGRDITGEDSIREEIPFNGWIFNRTPAVTKTGKRILVPIAPAIPEETIDEDDIVYFPFDHREPSLSNRFPKPMYLPPPRSSSLHHSRPHSSPHRNSRPRSSSLRSRSRSHPPHGRTLRSNSLGGKNKKRKRKTRKIV